MENEEVTTPVEETTPATETKPVEETKTAPAAKIPTGFVTKTIDWLGQSIEKIIGPGHNPEEIKFEGNTEGPYYVHSRAGMPIETIAKSVEPAENCFVRFGGSQKECQAFVTRGR